MSAIEGLEEEWTSQKLQANSVGVLYQRIRNDFHKISWDCSK